MNIAPAVQFVNDNWQKVYPGGKQTPFVADTRAEILIAMGIQELLDRGGKLTGSVASYKAPITSHYGAKLINDAMERMEYLSTIGTEPVYAPFVSDLDTQWGRLYLALLRDTPPAKQGVFTQADMDAAERKGYERCKADVARLRA